MGVKPKPHQVQYNSPVLPKLTPLLLVVYLEEPVNVGERHGGDVRVQVELCAADGVWDGPPSMIWGGW